MQAFYFILCVSRIFIADAEKTALQPLVRTFHPPFLDMPTWEAETGPSSRSPIGHMLRRDRQSWLCDSLSGYYSTSSKGFYRDRKTLTRSGKQLERLYFEARSLYNSKGVLTTSIIRHEKNLLYIRSHFRHYCGRFC